MNRSSTRSTPPMEIFQPSCPIHTLTAQSEVEEHVIPLASITHSFKFRYLKRGLDLSIAIPGLLLLLPLFPLIALWIKLTSPGPVFYAWNVIGRGGRPFRGYKFRTMVENA